MKQCQKCDNLVTDEQVKNCTSIGCLLRIGDEMNRKESAVDVGSPEPSDQKTGFDFGAVREQPEEGDQYNYIKNIEYPRARFITVKRWEGLHEDRKRFDAGNVFTSYKNCEEYFDYLVSQSQVTTLTNIAPGTGDGFSVAPRKEPIPSSMAMKFEVFGDPAQLANLSQRVLEILNEDAGVKIREFNYHISG